MQGVRTRRSKAIYNTTSKVEETKSLKEVTQKNKKRKFSELKQETDKQEQQNPKNFKKLKKNENEIKKVKEENIKAKNQQNQSSKKQDVIEKKENKRANTSKKPVTKSTSKNKVKNNTKSNRKSKKQSDSDYYDESEESNSESDHDSEFSLNNDQQEESSSFECVLIISREVIYSYNDDAKDSQNIKKDRKTDKYHGRSVLKKKVCKKVERARRKLQKEKANQYPDQKQEINEEEEKTYQIDTFKHIDNEGIDQEQLDIYQGTPHGNMLQIVDMQRDGPWFTQKEHIRDAEQRRPDDPSYDPSTVYIPPQEWKKLTPGMYRYWEIKSKNYDKIVFYRFGQWFIVYFQDAILCNKHIDLCIPPRQLQAIVGFHQSHLQEYTEKLVNKGFKVAICEQTETSKQMNKRISEVNLEDENEVKAVRREVAQIYSIGTFYKMEGNIDYDTKYVLSFYQQPGTAKFGFCYFDISTLKFYFGSFLDDFTLKQFRTLTIQTRPVEAICISSTTDKSETLMILKNSPIVPAMTYISMQEISDEEKLVEKMEKYLGDNREEWPEAIKQIFFDKKDHLSITAFSLAVIYLEKLLQAEISIPVADFFTMDEQNEELMKSGSMVIDAQAIEHLELLEVPGKSKNLRDGSFLNYISKGCSTPFGKRLLKRWVVGPLKDPAKINQRLDAVTDLVDDNVLRDKITMKLKKLPDLERMLSKIYTYSAKTSVKAIYIDIAVINRLDEFYNLLNHLKKLKSIISEVFDKDAIKKLQSSRLKALVTFSQPTDIENKRKSKGKKLDVEINQGIFPDYDHVIQSYEKMIQWKSVGSKKVPEPVEGLDEEFDNANSRVNKIKQRLSDYLEDIRKQMKSQQINYTTLSKRYRYEIEVSLELVKKIPEDFINTSNVVGKKRYQTDELRLMIEELEEEEDKFKDALVPFLRTMFKKFYENRDIFSKAIQCASELDCLCALAIISSNEEYGPMCKPEIITDNDKNPYIELKQMRHPCVQEQLVKSSIGSHQPPKKFIPNDVKMGSYKQEIDTPPILLITGPNMGGKSTLLRQTCLAAIMAQIGCYVSAQSCKLTIVDRVFTRIGASDRILENKSTFFVELEETKTIVEQSTKNSLVIMDELGRGTSTFDGYSIAHSVLTYIAQNIKCRTLFTTHYHMLVDEFKQIPNVVALYHMKSHVEEDQSKVDFLYKFLPGVAPQSFGIYVAKLAGIQDKVLKIAKLKSQEFNSKLDMLTNKIRESKK